MPLAFSPRRRSDPRRCCPQLVPLEARLPLGDTVLGSLVSLSLLGEHRAAPATATAAAALAARVSPGEPRALTPGFTHSHAWTPTARPAEGPFVTPLGAEILAPAWNALTNPFEQPGRPTGRRAVADPTLAPPTVPAPEALLIRASEPVVALPTLANQGQRDDGAALAFLAGLAASATPAATPDATPAQEDAVRANFAKLPLSFEANVGQTDAQVDFLTRGPGYALYLSATEATMVLSPPAEDAAGGGMLSRPCLDGSASPDCLGRESMAPAATAQDTRNLPAVVRMQVLGGNAAAPGSGVDRLPGVVSYFLGNDPSQWHTGITTYGRVTYDNVYPGIDLVWYGSHNQLEYDFVVAPGADPSAIRLSFTGAERVEIDAQGDLVLHLGGPGGVSPGSTLRQHAPVVYQEAGGQRQEVASRFVLEGQLVRFAVGAYDVARPLVIDPVLSYSTYLGGSRTEAGHGIAVDGAGNAFVTGQTLSTNFPTANPFQPACAEASCNNAFVVRLRADGSALDYATYLGGNSTEAGYGIAVDGAGNAFVTGWTQSTNFPTARPFQPTLRSVQDAFVVRLRADGSALDYSTYLGGGSDDFGRGVAVDGAGHAFVTGDTISTNFPTASPLQPANRGNGDAFVARLRADGSALDYSTYLGGSGWDYGQAVVVDGAGNAFLTGYTISTNFPTANPFQPNPGGGVCGFSTCPDAFVARLRADGSALLYSTYLGGSNYDGGLGIAVDGAGNAFVTGWTASTNFPIANPLQSASGGGYDAFVAKLRTDGTALDYATYLGGNGSEAGFGIAVDGAGNAFVGGYTSSTNFPTANPLQSANHGRNDAFVARLRADGSALDYSTYLGGGSDDYGRGIAVDGAGHAFVTGETSSTDFPTASSFQPGLNGSGVFHSTNESASWSRRNGAGLQGLVPSSLLVDPQDPATLYALSSGRVVKSTDGGDSWSPSGKGLGNRAITSLVIDPLTPSTLYAGINAPETDVGIFKSTDAGASWVSSYTGQYYRGISALAVDPVLPTTLYAGAWRLESNGIAVLYKSTDGGNTWVSSSTGIQAKSNRLSAVAVDPVSLTTVYAATALGVYRSTNGGGTWALSSTGLPGDVRHLAIALPVPTWLQVVSKTSTLYAVAQNRVYKSTNNGGTWTLSSTGLPTATISALVVSPAGQPALYVGTSAGIYKSTNAGASWTRADTGVTNPNVTALALAPSSPATLYASAATSGSDAFVARISP